MNEHARTLSRLAARAAGNLPPADEVQLARHLDYCPECRELARGFDRSLVALSRATEGVVSLPLAAAVRARVSRTESTSRVWDWKPVWAGAAVLASVFVFSVFMVHPRLTDQQVMKEYGDDLMALWKGGAMDSSNTWMQNGWDATTLLTREAQESGETN
jgi:anti-sigma factor RsiW